MGGPPDWWEGIGGACRRDFLALLPDDVEWKGSRILDFGCGAGRTLVHFTPEIERGAEVWGCDIDEESIEWVQAHLCPPFQAFRNEPMPPLPFEDASVDVVYAMSVFTHLSDTWSAWLLELHRVLKPGGFLLATLLGPGAEDDRGGRPWDDDRIGMLVLRPWHDFVGSNSGPTVFHSEWWVREHWGRGFDITEYWPWGFGAGGPGEEKEGWGAVAARKRDGAITIEELERPAEDPREWDAMRENLETVHVLERRMRARAEAAERELAAVRGTRSWRIAQAIAKLGRPFARRPTDG